MKTTLLMILVLAMGCETIYYQTVTDTDTNLEQLTEDTDCLGNEACIPTYNPECWVTTGQEGKEFVRTWEGCVCIDGQLVKYFEDQRCLEGCVVNQFGVDYCGEDAPTRI